MKIKKGQILEMGSWGPTGKKKIKILKIHAEKGDNKATSITYKVLGMFGYKNTLSTESFKNRVLQEIEEADI